MGCRRPSTSARTGVHRDGLEEAVNPSSGRLTLFGTRSPAIAFQPAPAEHQSVTTPFSTVNERARHPDPNSLTDLADLGCDFACVHRELSRGSQRPFSSPSFWHYFHFLGTIFLACGAQCIIHAALHLGGVQWLQQPRCKRASRVCLHRAHRVARRYHAPWHLGGKRQLWCLLVHDWATAAQCRSLVVAALAAMCSAFRLLVCRCTARCWGPVLALCMDRARHVCVTGCALCGARRLRSVQYWVMSSRVM